MALLVGCYMALLVAMPCLAVILYAHILYALSILAK